MHSTAHLFSAFIYVGYQSGFSLINSVEYTKIIISLFFASRWNGNLWWNPSIASFCIVGHTFNLLLLLCNYSYQWVLGKIYLCAWNFRTFVFVMNNLLFKLFVFIWFGQYKKFLEKLYSVVCLVCFQLGYWRSRFTLEEYQIWFDFISRINFHNFNYIGCCNK